MAKKATFGTCAFYVFKSIKIPDSEKNGANPGGIAFFLGFLFDENAGMVVR